MSAEPKVARDQAEAEVDLMLEALGVAYPDASAKEILLLAAMDGRVTFDEAKEEGTYILARSIHLENGGEVHEVKFHEPNGKELQFISQGQRVEVDGAKGTGFLDLGQTAKAAIRFLNKVSGLDLNVAERMKARDLAVVQAIAGFFQ